MTRALKPKATAALPVVPLLVTDQNSAAVCGLEGRQFRALVAKLGVRHLAHGKRLIVVADDLIEAIATAAGTKGIAAQGEDVDAAEPTRGDIIRRFQRGAR